MRFFKTPNIDFIGKRYYAFAFSIILFAIGLGALIVKGGPNYGIDFTGGILIQASFNQEISLNEVRTGLSKDKSLVFELQTVGKKGIIVRVKTTEKTQQEMTSAILTLLQSQFPTQTITIDRTEYVGPSVGKHLSKQASYAFFFAFLGIIIYVAFRFKSGLWGMSGVIAIVHDVFVVFGLMVFFNKEIDLTLIAALLTIAGYSINDTIVLFDRVRENLRLLAKENFGSIINKSINEVLGRTIITSATVFIIALILWLMGGEVISDCALAMLIGTFIGVYSSIFVVAPLIFEWEKRKRDRFKKAFNR